MMLVFKVSETCTEYFPSIKKLDFNHAAGTVKFTYTEYGRGYSYPEERPISSLIEIIE